MGDNKPGNKRPRGGRPPGRIGSGGTGPGPAYRPNKNTGGTNHKPGSSTDGCAVTALALMGGVLAAVSTGVWGIVELLS